MPGTIGIAPLPVVVPAAGASFADPALDVLGSFIRAVLNAECRAAWISVAPGEEMVRDVFTDNPENCLRACDLPALYLHRTEFAPSHETDGDYGHSSTVVGFWIYPPATRGRQSERDTIINGVASALITHFEVMNGRHPAWVVLGDTDPNATEYGSSLLSQGGFTTCKLTSLAPAQVSVDSMDFDAVHMTFSTIEVYAPRGPFAPTHLNTDLTIDSIPMGKVTV